MYLLKPALSPQCGFASTEDGNLLIEDEHWEKMDIRYRFAA
ncbi:hypothetical protein GCWU000342_02031 [Shuttleworthella satelles DSM 14600]|uniref:Uncharacterized protein n=1 Tax=Shuttleworthella satelles DSM 14600 TaxID=626523 RepID=C4GE85_9FIRM|nr:hypothetical protein GCWU000342_02031 [Shuttleworthia satelles DSM 14600]